MVGFPRTIWLVRHAESAGNVANAAAIAAGLPMLDLPTRDMDTPLSERGEAQARALSSWFLSLDPVPTIVWTSPYVRAMETARIAVEAAGLQIPGRIDERLREREFGILDRLTKVGIEQRFPEQAAARAFLGKFFHRPPGGESWVDVAARIRSVLVDLRTDHEGEDVVIVTHQAVVLLFRYVLEGLTEADVLTLDRTQDIANTAVTTFRSPDGGVPVLLSANDTAHLPAALTTDAPDVPVAPR